MLEQQTLEKKFNTVRTPINNSLEIWDCVEKLFLATKDKLHKETPKALIKLIEELLSDKTKLALKKHNFLVLYDQITDKDTSEVRKTKIAAFDTACKEIQIFAEQIQLKLQSIPALLIYYARERLSIDEAKYIGKKINKKQFQSYAAFLETTQKYTNACANLKSTRDKYRVLETELRKFIEEINMQEKIIALLSKLAEILGKKERTTIESYQTEYQANPNLDVKTKFINLLQKEWCSEEIKTVKIIATLSETNTPSNTDTDKGKKILKQIFNYLMEHQNIAYFEKDVVSTQIEYTSESKEFNPKLEEIKESIFKNLTNVSEYIGKKLEKDELRSVRFIQSGAIDKITEDFLAKIQTRVQGEQITRSSYKIDNNSQLQFTLEKKPGASYSSYPSFHAPSEPKENIPVGSLEKKEPEEEKKSTNPSYNPIFLTLDIQQEKKDEEEKNVALIVKYEKEQSEKKESKDGRPPSPDFSKP